MNFIASITIAFFVGISSILLLKNEKLIAKISEAVSLVVGVFVSWQALPVLFSKMEVWNNSIILMDKFSALMVFLVIFVYVAATFVSVRYILHEYYEKVIRIKDVKIYFALLHAFAFCMIFTVIANNSLLLWIALEGTTLTSTFLVGLYRRKNSVEAAWKYIIICSTGISLGLIGILLLSYGLHGKSAEGMNVFMLTELFKNAALVQSDILRLAFVFIFVGFGAKVGFAPLHTWLPDAHGNAPSPISAMFSGVLLNVALYVIIRFKFITDIGLGSANWSSKLFLFFGILSIVVPAFMMLIQNNYKRMLAYSSVEHMGIISLAISLSPLGAIASVVHMIGHTLTKSALFFGAGEILLGNGTTKTKKIHNLAKYFPYTAILFLVSILMIIAIPPSALFVSEYAIFTSALGKHSVISIFILIALSIIAFSMLKSTMMMFSRNEEVADGEIEIIKTKEKWNITHSVMVLQLLLVIVFGVWVSSKNGFEFIDSIAKNAVYISINDK